MISSLNDIKQGLTIIHNNEPYQVIQARFVRMQQRKPVMQTKLKNLINGKVLEYNFKPGDKVEEAEITRKKVNYLYKAGSEFFFMDNETYEQSALNINQLGGKEKFLKEGSAVSLLLFNGTPINIELPPKMEFKVISAPPGVKGDTAQGRVTKTVTLENGIQVQTPLFIKEGDRVRINTETGEYAERVS